MTWAPGQIRGPRTEWARLYAAHDLGAGGATGFERFLTATTWTGLGGSYAATNGASVSIAGMEESNISYLVDGIETRNARFGSEDLHPSVDALQEFKMQTDAFRPNTVDLPRSLT